MLCMPMFSVCFFFFWGGDGGGGVNFCGVYCPSVIVFLAIGGTCRCEHTLLCEQIVKRHLYIFIHSLFSCHQWGLRVWCIYVCVTSKDYRHDAYLSVSPLRITDMMYIYLCHQWGFQVWCTSMSPVKITGMMNKNVTGEDYRYDE